MQIVTLVGVERRISPQTFLLQAKSTSGAFTSAPTAVDIDTRHLALWTDPTATPMLVVLWSKPSNSLRVRTARELRTEVDVRSADWTSQDTVSCSFRPAHQFGTVVGLEELARMMGDELDALGGRLQFHRHRRRVLLSSLMATRLSGPMTVQFKESATDGGPGALHLGTGWEFADIDPIDRGIHKFVSALLLYEEVWLPMQFAADLVSALGLTHVAALIERRRLRLMYPVAEVGVTESENGVRGKLGQASHSVLSGGEAVKRWCGSIEKSLRITGLARVLARAVELVPENVSTRTIEDVVADLSTKSIRKSLGLGGDTAFAVWDRELVNRLLHLEPGSRPLRITIRSTL
ncbi:MAG: hypothetical protein IPL61_28390 [Myxococcales bacterium]|nr:hypothetical protein [Myxococcales bacterium]